MRVWIVEDAWPVLSSLHGQDKRRKLFFVLTIKCMACANSDLSNKIDTSIGIWIGINADLACLMLC